MACSEIVDMVTVWADVRGVEVEFGPQSRFDDAMQGCTATDATIRFDSAPLVLTAERISVEGVTLEAWVRGAAQDPGILVVQAEGLSPLGAGRAWDFGAQVGWDRAKGRLVIAEGEVRGPADATLLSLRGALRLADLAVDALHMRAEGRGAFDALVLPLLARESPEAWSGALATGLEALPEEVAPRESRVALAGWLAQAGPDAGGLTLVLRTGAPLEVAPLLAALRGEGALGPALAGGALQAWFEPPAAEGQAGE
ncbi:hypothetical protein [Vannielia litorea]|uniref:hypothetical protein n=1 Tax=Vannielia litorea TaxID=1217970 RepID=UPI0011154236|nr:hypothetical protein [Vannielia litorea]